MDQIWLASPSPAMRLWPTSRGATWRLNPAATAWARGVQWTEASWRAVAAELSEVHSTSPAREGRITGASLRWRSLPMSTGWLIWFMPEASGVDVGSEAARALAERPLHETGEVERASAARSEFVARMSHELRTPLNAVLGFAQLMEHDAASVPIQVQLDRVVHIRQAGEQLLALVGDVLEHLKQDVLPDHAAAAALQAAAAAGDDTAAARSRSLSVLYIEDNPVNVILVEELVGMRPDTALRCAVDGLAGVAEAHANRPDVVLVDMQLPDIDGFEVLRRLRANRDLDGSAIIALSANGMSEDIARARAAGFDDYWTKPIDFRHFLQGLDALARIRQTPSNGPADVGVGA